MSTIVLEAQTRTDMGKGASRRLRRLENKVLAVVYGGDNKPQSIQLSHNKVVKALEDERIYASVFDLMVDGKAQRVILKDLQHHPYKPVIMHMDLQRVSAKDILVKQIPIHFINEDVCPGVKGGGLVIHTMTQVEVRCSADKLPEFIEVDMAKVGMNDVVHIFDICLPKGVELAIDRKEESHNLPVVSIHSSKVALQEEVDVTKSEEASEAESAEKAEKKADES